jgi:hypothetical protein
MRALFLILLAMTACGRDEDTDTDVPIDTGPVDTGCPELFVESTGPNPPQVGDTWTVLLKCQESATEESVITGPMILRPNPLDAAQIDAPEVTFLKAGELSLLVQVGSYRVTEQITVLE